MTLMLARLRRDDKPIILPEASKRRVPEASKKRAPAATVASTRCAGERLSASRTLRPGAGPWTRSVNSAYVASATNDNAPTDMVNEMAA